MSLPKTKISLLIATKNRREDLFLTLQKIMPLVEKNDIACVVFDDGSTDGTSQMLQNYYPSILLLRNEMSKGYIFCRNKMLNETTADYAISLDDDAHFLTENPIEIIENYFSENLKCGLLALRIYWNKNKLENEATKETSQIVKSFVGCGHVWRMNAWNEIANYPEWFEFYGEENFAALQLFINKWEIHYLPNILVQHRVDLKTRTIANKDFGFRYRRALRADWYNFFMFYPKLEIVKKMSYSIAMQFKNKIFKGDFKVIKPVFLALMDVIINFPKIVKNKKRFTSEEYQNYMKLNDAKIYWNPEK